MKQWQAKLFHKAVEATSFIVKQQQLLAGRNFSIISTALEKKTHLFSLPWTPNAVVKSSLNVAGLPNTMRGSNAIRSSIVSRVPTLHARLPLLIQRQNASAARRTFKKRMFLINTHT